MSWYTGGIFRYFSGTVAHVVISDKKRLGLLNPSPADAKRRRGKGEIAMIKVY